MKLVIAETYEALSIQVADRLIDLVGDKKEPLISPASGDSPAGIYAKLVDKVTRKELDVSTWNFVGLDEWLGMNGTDEGSCRYHLNQQLFSPLQITPERICFFDGRAEALKEECMGTDSFIVEHGGIDVAIVGLGMNGHIGMNEPGTDESLKSHVTDIDPVTQKVGQKYFSSEKKLSGGVTLGIASLLEARHLILVVSGAHKASIVQQALNSPISSSIPATLLRHHPGFEIFLDKAAAQLIPHGE